MCLALVAMKASKMSVFTAIFQVNHCDQHLPIIILSEVLERKGRFVKGSRMWSVIPGKGVLPNCAIGQLDELNTGPLAPSLQVQRSTP